MSRMDSSQHLSTALTSSPANSPSMVIVIPRESFVVKIRIIVGHRTMIDARRYPMYISPAEPVSRPRSCANSAEAISTCPVMIARAPCPLRSGRAEPGRRANRKWHRADGRIEFDLHLMIEDSHRMALSGDGQPAPRAGSRHLRKCPPFAASKDYAPGHERQIWVVRTASLATGKVLAEGFMQ